MFRSLSYVVLAKEDLHQCSWEARTAYPNMIHFAQVYRKSHILLFCCPNQVFRRFHIFSEPKPVNGSEQRNSRILQWWSRHHLNPVSTWLVWHSNLALHPSPIRNSTGFCYSKTVLTYLRYYFSSQNLLHVLPYGKDNFQE